MSARDNEKRGASAARRKPDTTLAALTPEGIEFTLNPAGLAARGTAYAIDAALQWTVIFVLYLAAESLRWSGKWAFFLALFVVEWFYHVICEVFFRGQSVGKKAAGIRVVRRDGSPLDPASSILRNLLRFADTFLSLYHIACILICVNQGFRRIGDFAAGTLVVYTSAARCAVPRCMPHIAGEAVPPPRALRFEEKEALIALAARYALLGRPRADEIVKPWTDALGWRPFAEKGNALSPSAYALGIAKNWTGGQ
jgi:uncharacterized RDD family membrane protein YckC